MFKQERIYEQGEAIPGDPAMKLDILTSDMDPLSLVEKSHLLSDNLSGSNHSTQTNLEGNGYLRNCSIGETNFIINSLTHNEHEIGTNGNNPRCIEDGVSCRVENQKEATRYQEEYGTSAYEKETRDVDISLR